MQLYRGQKIDEDLTKYVDEAFVWGLYFVAFMLLQCSVTGFSPPCIILTNVLKVVDDKKIVRCCGARAIGEA